MDVQRRFVGNYGRVAFLEVLDAAVEGKGLENVEGWAAGCHASAHPGLETGYAPMVGSWWRRRRA